MSPHSINRKNNFLYLALSLVGMLLAGAVTAQFPGTILDTLFSLFLAAMILLGAKSLHTETAWRRIVYVMALFMAATVLLLHIYPSRWTLLLLYLTLLLFFLGSFKLAVRQILFEGEVDANKIVGSLSLYLLIGLIWTVIYLSLLVFDPNALKGIETVAWESLFFHMAYYSFITLTTLGYGDIAPATPLAQFFVTLEAVTGVFYMAIFVSSLVNLRWASTSGKGS